MSMNNMCIQPNVIGQKVNAVKNAATNKYMTQTGPNISSIGQTSCISTGIPYRTNESMTANDQRVTTTYRAIQPSSEQRPSPATKSITVINHPANVSAENSCLQPTKKEAEWNQLYVLSNFQMFFSISFRNYP